MQKYGIRCAYVNYRTEIMTEEDLEKYHGFKGNEFLISEKTQILPLYAVTMRRVEYLIIWRDYNFDSQNPNNYTKTIFKEMQDFHLKLRIFYIEN